MTCRGVVRNGKVELDQGVSLPEGSVVSVETIARQPEDARAAAKESESSARHAAHAAWLAELDRLSAEIDRAWKSPKTALEVLSESRR